MWDQVHLVENTDHDGLPPSEEDQGLDTQELSDGANGPQLVLGCVVEKNQTVECPTLTEIRKDTNVEVSSLGSKVSFFVDLISLQYHNDNAADELEQDILKDAKLAFDKEWTCPMHSFQWLRRRGQRVDQRCGTWSGTSTHATRDRR